MRDSSLSPQERASAASEILKTNPNNAEAKAVRALLGGRTSIEPVLNAGVPATNPDIALRTQTTEVAKQRGFQIRDLPGMTPGEVSAVQKGPGLIDRATESVMSRVDRVIGIRPDERPRVARAVGVGAAIGAGAGAVGGGLVASGVCAPAFVTGAPYGLCVAAGGAAGVAIGAPVVGFAGGVLRVAFGRLDEGVQNFQEGFSP